MFAIVITLITLLVATSQATASSGTPSSQPTTLPQCGNLTLTWTKGVPPYAIHIADVTDNQLVTLHSNHNSAEWVINAKVDTGVYFLVKDARNTTSAGGPYQVAYSGDTSCLCDPPSRRGEGMRRNAQSESKRAGITLPTVLERDAWSFLGSKRSSRHSRRRVGSRRPAGECTGL